MFCDSYEAALGCRIGVYDLDGTLIAGEDLGFVTTKSYEIHDDMTIIKSGNYIIVANKKLSQETCRVIEITGKYLNKKEAEGFSQPLSYILANNLSNELIRGRYCSSVVLYIKTAQDISDILTNIYEGQTFEIHRDGEGLFLVKEIDDVFSEGNSIISGISEENGIDVIIGCGRVIEGEYTVKDSAYQAKEAAVLAGQLGFREGFYHIDKMILYSIINISDSVKIKEYIKGGYTKFLDILGDKELVSTAEELFKCNLNISETARRMFVHRNTLLYRIDKIKNITGLDINNFDDAIIFKTILTAYKLKLT